MKSQDAPKMKLPDAFLKILSGGNAFWWTYDKDKVHEPLCAYISDLRKNQEYRAAANLHHARMYGNFEAMGLTSSTYARPAKSKQERVTWNVIASGIDTITAKITKNKPIPSFVTMDGNWTLRKRAKGAEQYVRGQFYALKAHQLMRRVFRDSTIFGSGFALVSSLAGKVYAERIFPDELLVDDMEAIHGDPRNLFRTKAIPRAVVAAWAFDSETKTWDHEMLAAVAKSPRSDQRSDTPESRRADMIDVHEAWHLPSGDGVADGVCVKVIAGYTISHDEWKRPKFPIAKINWKDPTLGYFGQGLAEEMSGDQTEINFTLQRLQEKIRLGVPWVLTEEGSKINPAHLRNVPGNVVVYRGMKPEIVAFATTNPEEFNWLLTLWSKAFEKTGISQASAAAKNPLGPNASGEALRQYNDIESERFVDKGQDYETLSMDFTDLILEETRELAEANGGSLKVISQSKKYGRTFIDEVDWKDIRLDREQYQLQVFPISSLSTQPSGRMQQVKEMYDAKWIERDDAVSLIDIPDLERTRRRITAAIDNIDEMIDDFLDGKDYRPPEPFQPLQLGMKRCLDAYLQAQRQGYPEDALEKLRRWMRDAQQLNAKQQSPAGPAPALPMPGAPPAGGAQAPMTPPTA